MARQFLGFGDGSDGNVTLSGTGSPTDASCSGSAGAMSLAATNASFASGQIILIHQSRGTGAAAWELNQIKSYTGGTITLAFPLVNTYTDSGDSQAQVLVVPQYGNVTISGTYTCKSWTQDVGGIIAFMANGAVTISGDVSANATGFRNDGAAGTGGGAGQQGEGTGGAGATSTAANGDGAGGGGSSGASGGGAGGGGGGNGATGTAGDDVPAVSTGGAGGEAVGSADLSTMAMGGEGGGGGSDGTGNGGSGGNGGGIVMIFAKEITVSGSITSNGATGGNAAVSGSGGGGGGAGGSILIKSLKATLGSGLITASAGSGNTGQGHNGGAGAVGRIRVESGSISGTTTPSASENEGGNAWQGGLGLFY